MNYGSSGLTIASISNGANILSLQSRAKALELAALRERAQRLKAFQNRLDYIETDKTEAIFERARNLVARWK